MERHAYGPDPSQHGELTTPGRRGPVAVLLHGGCWRSVYGTGLMAALAGDLAGRGWATWNLEYRRLGRGSGGGYPMTLEDVAAGIDHLGSLSGPAAAQLDLGRVVAVGHSAGGQLAAWAAARPAPGVALRRLVVQAGVVDLRAAHRLGVCDRAVAQLLGGGPDAVPERYAAASPRERLPLGVPTLLTHGGRDEVVPVALSRRFVRAARRAGDEAALHVEPGEGHLGHLDPGNPLWRAARSWLEAGGFA